MSCSVDVHFHAGEPLRYRAIVVVKPPVEVKDYRGIPLERKAVEVTDQEVDRALAITETLRNAAESQGVALETLVLKGRLEAALVKAVGAKEVDLIILGSHGRTGLKRLLMGSVAERVIGQSPCAVLVVKRGAR